MPRIKLEDQVTEKKMVEVVVRSDLYALKCDACGKIFQMKEYCNDTNLAEICGTFDRCVESQGLGNMFHATCCSFHCAHSLFDGKGWKLIPQYKPYVDAGAALVRAKLQITSMVLDEAAIRDKWLTKGGQGSI